LTCVAQFQVLAQTKEAEDVIKWMGARWCE